MMHGSDRFRGLLARIGTFRGDRPIPLSPTANRLGTGLWEVHIMVVQLENACPDPEIRAELVARIRRAIQQGTYETPEKLEIAFQRLLEELTEDS